MFETRKCVKINRDISIYFPTVSDRQKNATDRIIIAGFIATGKTEACMNYPNKYLDMDTSEYHWDTSSGEKILDPNWPKNYVEAAIKAANDADAEYKYVLISTHNEVLEELDKRGIIYTALIPRTREVGIKRNAYRGDEFISRLEKNYDEYMNMIDNSGVYALYQSDKTISDVFK